MSRPKKVTKQPVNKQAIKEKEENEEEVKIVSGQISIETVRQEKLKDMSPDKRQKFYNSMIEFLIKEMKLYDKFMSQSYEKDFFMARVKLIAEFHGVPTGEMYKAERWGGLTVHEDDKKIIDIYIQEKANAK